MIEDFSTAPQPPEAPELPKVYCRVMLTPEQKRIVLEKTGRELDYVDIDDDNRETSKKMKSSTPADITPEALAFAMILNQYDEAYKEYLIELEKWQERQKNNETSQNEEESRIKAQQLAEKQKVFFEQEQKAIEDARALARSIKKPPKKT